MKDRKEHATDIVAFMLEHFHTDRESAIKFLEDCNGFVTPVLAQKDFASRGAWRGATLFDQVAGIMRAAECTSTHWRNAISRAAKTLRDRIEDAPSKQEIREAFAEIRRNLAQVAARTRPEKKRSVWAQFHP